MTVAPTQLAGSPFQTSSWATGVPKTIAVGAVGAGALVVVGIATEDSSADPAVPTNSAAGPATLTAFAAGPTVTAASYGRMEMYSATVTVAGNLTISVASSAGISGTTNWGFAAWVFPAGGHNGLGTTAVGNVTGTAPSASATWAAHSAVCCVMPDWSAAVITGRTYRANIGAATEVNAVQVDSNYSAYAWYHADSGAGGTQAVGLTAPTMTWALGAMEVLGPAGTSAVASLDPQIQWTDDFGPGEDFGPNPFIDDSAFSTNTPAAAGGTPVTFVMDAIPSAVAAGIVPTVRTRTTPPLAAAVASAATPTLRAIVKPVIAAATAAGLVPTARTRTTPPIAAATAAGLVPAKLTALVTAAGSAATAAALIPRPQARPAPPVGSATAAGQVPNSRLVVHAVTATALAAAGAPIEPGGGGTGAAPQWIGLKGMDEQTAAVYAHGRRRRI